VVREYRKGEKAYRTGLLEAGRLCDLYCHQCMALGDKRAAAAQALEGELAKWSSTTVEVNRLIGCYQAYRLLVEEPAVKADSVAYGTYRDAWCLLVERHLMDTPAVGWRLLVGLEAECRELFARAAKDGLSKAACQDGVKGLLRTYADRQGEQARQAKEQADRQAKEAAERERRAREQREQADRASAEERERLTAEAQRQADELLAKQRVEIKARAEREQADREQAGKEREQLDAEEARRKAEEKAKRAAERKQQAGSKPPAQNVLPNKPTDAASMAALAAEYITECDTPDDVFALLLRRLKDSGELSKQSVRAIDAALLILNRTDKPASESKNGQLASAAA
jgi:hypothetical protein